MLVPEQDRVDRNEDGERDNPQTPRREPRLGEKPARDHEQHSEEMLNGGGKVEHRNMGYGGD